MVFSLSLSDRLLSRFKLFDVFIARVSELHIFIEKCTSRELLLGEQF